MKNLFKGLLCLALGRLQLFRRRSDRIFIEALRKGWLCKTYEGELAMTTVPGVAPTLWTFSVWDDDVATTLDGQLGKRVVLHYRELRFVPTTCFGETNYFVDRADIVDPPG